MAYEQNEIQKQISDAELPPIAKMSGNDQIDYVKILNPDFIVKHDKVNGHIIGNDQIVNTQHQIKNIFEKYACGSLLPNQGELDRQILSSHGDETNVEQ